MMLRKGPSRAAKRKEQRRKDTQQERAIYRAVYLRDGYRCRACKAAVSPGALDLARRAHHHHVIFRSAGGPTTMANVMTSCAECHFQRHDYTLSIRGNADVKGGLTFERVSEDGSRVRTWTS